MEISIIAIGDELLLGQVTDTNSGFIARTISPEGWRVADVAVVADSSADIISAIDRAFHRSSIVITTGGLGPTKDDITKEALLNYFGGRLKYNEEVMANCRRIFQQRGLQMNALTESQAMVPTSAHILNNRWGTAPIMWFEDTIRERVLVAMPGVPAETRHMFVEEVFPRLLEKFPSTEQTVHHTIMVEGISESALALQLEPWEKALPSNFHLAYLPDSGILRLRLDAKGSDSEVLAKEIDLYSHQLKDMCGEHLLYDGDKSPAEILLDLLKTTNRTVATAESCTGGNIAHAITSIAGSSAAMLGGVISYANEVKANVLGVDPEVIATNGAVSQPVVTQMAEGVRRLTGAYLSMATSGIAGPGGGTEEKPVGTVWIAVSTPIATTARCFRFGGDRLGVIRRATLAALIMAIRALNP
ncbi:MAG: CinA family nicotinamide mononucleotide deamidase-related protein [Bacteroides sp.]|nr:CinA family nicotinamide mononucleotide deamidase-related protein [Bacteroides sp.]MCM1412894.1 CinA family nicotinamide mononucleotide deamidase-related protein [Bacteroides sp.]MCM1471563.1 CinA family nicotinamide mononucleotide deamidase-related protein [Bacteroides sp.]